MSQRSTARSLGVLVFWGPAVLIGVAAVVLAGIGWWEYLAARPAETTGVWRPGDVAVRAVKALLLSDIYYEESAMATLVGGRPVLQWARDLGVTFSVLMAGRLLLFAWTSMTVGVALRWRRGHDIVFGESEAARAYAETVSLDRKVTWVKQAERNRRGRLALLRRDQTVERELEDAGYRTARRIVVAEESDEASWKTADEVNTAAPLAELVVHVSDFWVNERFERRMAVRSYSYAGGAARQVILAHPPFLLARRMSAPAQHIIVVGFGDMGQALVREFLGASVALHPRKMMVTVVTDDAEAAKCGFEERCPGFATGADGGDVDIVFLQGDLTTGVGPGAGADAPPAAGHRLDADFAARCAAAAPAAVYIALAEEESPLRSAIILRERAVKNGWFRAPIFVWRAGGLERVTQGVGAVGEVDKDGAPVVRPGEIASLGLYAFGSWSEAMDGEGLFEPELDGRARAYHAAYEQAQRGKAPAGAQSAAVTDWRTLREDFRVSNRRVAYHIRSKLDAVGFDLAGWLADPSAHWMTHDLPAEAAREFDMDEASEMDALAELEHRRWLLDRILNGWRWAEKRDNFHRLHPKLIPFDQLDEAEIEKDRVNVRETAKILQELVSERGVDRKGRGR